MSTSDWSQEIIQSMEERASSQELMGIARELRASYDPYMRDPESWALLQRVLPSDLHEALGRARKEHIAHHLIGHIMLRYYPGEETVKYHYVRSEVDAKDDVLLLEMAVNGCRLDVGKVNGESYVLEIKTELDNLSRLESQIATYAEVFENVIVLTHPKHIEMVQSKAPAFCGVLTYELQGDACTFTEVRSCERSPKIRPDAQVEKLTSRDLAYVLKMQGESRIPTLRTEREALISRYDAATVNLLFKQALRSRFARSSTFVLDILDQIAPTDLGFFFHSRISPDLVYYKPSATDWM